MSAPLCAFLLERKVMSIDSVSLYIKERAAQVVVKKYLDKRTATGIMEVGSATPYYSGLRDPQNKNILEPYSDEIYEHLDLAEELLRSVFEELNGGIPFGINVQLIQQFSSKEEILEFELMNKVLKQAGNEEVSEETVEKYCKHFPESVGNLFLNLADTSETFSDCYLKQKKILLALAVMKTLKDGKSSYPQYILQWCDTVLN